MSGWARGPWGEKAGLSFTPLATKAYGLIVKARDLGDPRVVRLCEVAQSSEFRGRISEVAGYNPVGAGTSGTTTNKASAVGCEARTDLGSEPDRLSRPREEVGKAPSCSA